MTEPPSEPPRKPKSRAGRVAFVARKSVIEAALHAGHTMRAVYDEHRASIPLSYVQFVRYVARYLPAAYAEHARSPRGARRTSGTSPSAEVGVGAPASLEAAADARPAMPATAPARPTVSTPPDGATGPRDAPLIAVPAAPRGRTTPRGAPPPTAARVAATIPPASPPAPPHAAPSQRPDPSPAGRTPGTAGTAFVHPAEPVADENLI